MSRVSQGSCRTLRVKMSPVSTFSFPEARDCVREKVLSMRRPPDTEHVALLECASRVLAEEISADRDYPTLARSVRDGFAVRAADFPGRVRIIGEVRAGDRFQGEVSAGEAVEIMTGAPLPSGADAVIMIEHTTRDGDWMTTDHRVTAGDFINVQGCEARRGDRLLERGTRLGYAHVAMLATVGRTHVSVYRKPRVAILATGDEIVEIGETPLDHQIRNSNSDSLAVQVQNAGGIPSILPVARDTY